MILISLCYCWYTDRDEGGSGAVLECHSFRLILLSKNPGFNMNLDNRSVGLSLYYLLS